jgi:hypothetical protein
VRAEARLSLVVEDKTLGLLIEVVGQHIGTQAMPGFERALWFRPHSGRGGYRSGCQPGLARSFPFPCIEGERGTLRSPLCTFLV